MIYSHIENEELKEFDTSTTTFSRALAGGTWEKFLLGESVCAYAWTQTGRSALCAGPAREAETYTGNVFQRLNQAAGRESRFKLRLWYVLAAAVAGIGWVAW